MLKPVAETLITNGRPWSDGARLEDADSVAIAGGRILAVGRASELEALASPRTARLDARGATLTPGITDAHIHLLAWAGSVEEVSLTDAGSRAEVLERVTGHLRANPGDATLMGRGWEDAGWSEPVERAPLDALAPERPVMLHRHDFHALWVNGAALRAAGVTRSTPDPEGGRIVRDAAGEPTGLVLEHAVRLFAALEARHSPSAVRARVEQAVRRLHALGITAVHDFEGAAALRMLHAMTRSEGPWVRVLMHLTHAGLDEALDLGLESGIGDDRFRLGAVKLFSDGTLGSRTAAMLAPYQGGSDTGMDLIPPSELRDTVRRALEGGLSVAIHAIGDRAVRSSLDAFEGAGEARSRVALMPRIEHAQLVDPADLPRFAGLGVAASMQPLHAVSDRVKAERYWGSRAAGSYPWRRIVGSGALVAFGSDAPVEPPDPALGIHAAVVRSAPGDDTPFSPAERLTLDEALLRYTATPARLAGQWPRVGRLAPGAAADVVVWSADLHALPPARLHEARVAVTLLEGERVYEQGMDAAAPAGIPGRGAVAVGGAT